MRAHIRRLARRAGLGLACVPAAVLALTASAAAADRAADTGATAWVLTSSALVLFMTLPGLALFYGGLVRGRNLLSVLMHCFAICCVTSVIWGLFGYSLAFGTGGDWLGPLNKTLLSSLGDKVLPGGLPENVFVLFQMTFAVITPALFIGAFVERVRFSFVVLFSALWMIIVYLPVCHWVWGGGWLAAKGTLDFAGGIVVHTTAGVTALVLAVMIGPRHTFPRTLVPPHSPGLTMAGGAMLWVGWFGFNGGSALTADGAAGAAILATHFAASAAALMWITIEWLRTGKPTSVGMVTGAIAGLATITPASGYVGPMAGLIIGAISGVVCLYAVNWIKLSLKIDDSLDVFAVHGVGGMIGTILLAVFIGKAWGGVGYADGMDLLKQLQVQVMGVVTAAAWSGAVTFVLVKVLAAATGVRVSPDQEREGLDLSSHGERAYEDA
jgi:Amt family ammonium transporter